MRELSKDLSGLTFRQILRGDALHAKKVLSHCSWNVKENIDRSGYWDCRGHSVLNMLTKVYRGEDHSLVESFAVQNIIWK